MQKTTPLKQINRTCLYPLFLLSFFGFTWLSCKQPGKSTNTQKPSVEVIESKRDLSNIRVGYCTPSLNAPFYVALSNAIERNVNAYHMRFLSVDGQGDITKQVMGIEDLISKGVNVLIVNPLDPKALVPSVNRAVKSGIPVFIVDSYMDPKANYAVSVLADNEGNGELLGEWIVDKVKNIPLKVALVSGAPGNPVGREKRLGFVRGVIDRQLKTEGNAKLRIVSQGWGGWTIHGGLKAMEDILVAHPEVNLVVAENDAMAIGALKAIEGSGIDQNIKVLGFDGQKDALKLIKDGEMAATALNSPAELGRLVVNAVVRNLNGNESTGLIVHTNPVLINHDNVDKFYNPDAPF